MPRRFEERRLCVVCGREYTARAENAKYCSIACKLRMEAQRRKESRQPATGKLVHCAICGREFMAYGGGPRLFCSDECRSKNRLVIMDRYREKRRVRCKACGRVLHNKAYDLCCYCREVKKR